MNECLVYAAYIVLVSLTVALVGFLIWVEITDPSLVRSCDFLLSSGHESEALRSRRSERATELFMSRREGILAHWESQKPFATFSYAVGPFDGVLSQYHIPDDAYPEPMELAEECFEQATREITA